MSGNKHSGNRTGRTTPQQRASTVAPRSPNQRARKLIKQERTPLDTIPPFPKAMQPRTADPKHAYRWADDRARQIWTDLSTLLVEHRMLDALDLPALEMAVMQQRIAELAAVEGKMTPAIAASRAATTTLTALGLTKSGRISPDAAGLPDHPNNAFATLLTPRHSIT